MYGDFLHHHTLFKYEISTAKGVFSKMMIKHGKGKNNMHAQENMPFTKLWGESKNAGICIHILLKCDFFSMPAVHKAMKLQTPVVYITQQTSAA